MNSYEEGKSRTHKTQNQLVPLGEMEGRLGWPTSRGEGGLENESKVL
jgi:hypothetical protein